MTNARMVDELFEWLRIPSISSGGGDPADLKRAADWARDRILAAGGVAEVLTTEGNPLTVGELRASSPDAPTVLIYGHYDVQSADPIEEWTTPPFEPTVRDERIYARGAADDKGNFYPLLYVACELATKGILPVNVRVLLEGEEEVAGDSATKWLLADERGADCAIVFDGGMLNEKMPAITLGVRGVVAVDLKVSTARANLHSGLYGGTVLNAMHVLQTMLAQVLPGPDGRLRNELREGIELPGDEELKAWAELPRIDNELDQVGGRPIHEGSVDDYYIQNWADASLDVNGIAGGDAVQQRTIIPATARARFTMRLAPRQEGHKMAAVMEELLRSAVPAGAEIELDLHSDDPAVFDPASPPLRIAIAAIEEACGTRPALIRSGGSIPVLAAFASRDIPTILSGFALPWDAFHAPDESYRLESLRLGEAAARALYERLASLANVG